MAWFGLFKKKDEKYRITLEDVRNNTVNIDYLIWKYKNLSKRNDHHSVCLFLYSHVVEATDTDEEINKRKKEFVEEIKKKPSEKRQFINSKTGTHLLWDKDKLIRMDSDKIDWFCLKDTITQIQKKEKINLHHWAFIYKLVKDGKLGSDVSGISVDNFREKMKTLNLNIAARNTIYDYVPRGTYPNYLPASKKDNKYNYNREANRIQTFTKHFVEIYYTILDDQVSLEEFLSIE
jgi:hypothetical protein